MARSKKVARSAGSPIGEKPKRERKSTTQPSPPKPSTDAGDPETSPLRSVHSLNLPGILDRAGLSLLVSTYQTGKVITVRHDAGRVNTHFASFDTPMGLAFGGGRLVIGGRTQIFEFRNQPAVTRQLDPPGKRDACFVPRSTHFTGDIRVHELALVGGEVWIVNTRFCCLCTLDSEHSFVPQWRPSFVTALAPEDRCHLNGLEVVDGRPRYVTALAQTDTPAGWREQKLDGGCIIDISTNKVITSGLCMPHSPTWHDNKLWFLESGKGELGCIDPTNGTRRTVARLPGFTRGLRFIGPIAIVGLSQVRESAIFGGLPITESSDERACGVWFVDTRTGATVAWLKFLDAVQEIFAIELLPGLRFPEIVVSDQKALASAFQLPESALADVPAAHRAPQKAVSSTTASRQVA
jgi:uncharacterized protein (TIGR03032 family)